MFWRFWGLESHVWQDDFVHENWFAGIWFPTDKTKCSSSAKHGCPVAPQEACCWSLEEASKASQDRREHGTTTLGWESCESTSNHHVSHMPQPGKTSKMSRIPPLWFSLCMVMQHLTLRQIPFWRSACEAWPHLCLWEPAVAYFALPKSMVSKETLDPVWKAVAWRFGTMGKGTWPSNGLSVLDGWAAKHKGKAFTLWPLSCIQTTKKVQGCTQTA